MWILRRAQNARANCGSICTLLSFRNKLGNNLIEISIWRWKSKKSRGQKTATGHQPGPLFRAMAWGRYPAWDYPAEPTTPHPTAPLRMCVVRRKNSPPATALSELEKCPENGEPWKWASPNRKPSSVNYQRRAWNKMEVKNNKHRPEKRS